MIKSGDGAWSLSEKREPNIESSYIGVDSFAPRALFGNQASKNLSTPFIQENHSNFQPSTIISAGELLVHPKLVRIISCDVDGWLHNLLFSLHHALNSANRWLQNAFVGLKTELEIVCSGLSQKTSHVVEEDQVTNIGSPIFHQEARNGLIFQTTDSRELVSHHSSPPRQSSVATSSNLYPSRRFTPFLGLSFKRNPYHGTPAANLWTSKLTAHFRNTTVTDPAMSHSKVEREAFWLADSQGNLNHSDSNIRFNFEAHDGLKFPGQQASNLPHLVAEEGTEGIQQACFSICSVNDWDWMTGAPDILHSTQPVNQIQSLEMENLEPSPAGTFMHSSLDEWTLNAPDQIPSTRMVETMPVMIIPQIPPPAGYNSVDDVPPDILSVIRESFFEQVPGGYRKDCCLLQFRADKQIGTVQELANLFSNYGDIEKVVYNQYLGAYLYCYLHPSGVELSEKYLRPLNLIGMNFGLLPSPAEEQIASVFFPPKISARFTKFASFTPKKRFSVRSEGIPVKPNRIGKCLHITYSGSDKSKADLSTIVFGALSEVHPIKKTKVDAGVGKKNMWFAEFETIQDAIQVLMKCHNMKVSVGQLRLSFTKNL